MVSSALATTMMMMMIIPTFVVEPAPIEVMKEALSVSIQHAMTQDATIVIQVPC